MRALLVHNGNAGTDPTSRRDIEAVLRNARIEVLYCSHGSDSLSAALRDNFDFIIAAGGDGTVADVVSELNNVDVPIGILPLGGSNNIANALGVAGDWRGIPSHWSLSAWTRLDRCEADGPCGRKTFVEALGSGVLTEAVHEAEENPRTPQEKQQQGRAAFRTALKRADPFECSIEADGWKWQGECLMVEIMNIGLIGSRLALADGVASGDGMIDVTVVTPDQRDILHAWTMSPDDTPSPISRRPASVVNLTVHDRPIRLDDQALNEHYSGTIRICTRPNSVKILTPWKQKRC